MLTSALPISTTHIKQMLQMAFYMACFYLPLVYVSVIPRGLTRRPSEGLRDGYGLPHVAGVTGNEKQLNPTPPTFLSSGLIFYDTKVTVMNRVLNATVQRTADHAAPEITLDPLEIVGGRADCSP